MHPVQYTQAAIASAGTTMTTNGKLITASLGNFPQQILPSFVSSNNHQPVIISQYGTAANQQSIGNFRHKEEARSWKEHTYKFQNQLPVVRPNSFYASVVPVHSSQIFNGCHIGEISPQPQIITAQESGTILNQAHLQGLPTINALPSGLSLTPGFHPYQNSFILCNQPSGMTLHQIQPQMSIQPASNTALPVPTATLRIVAPMTKKKLKELKPREKTIRQLSSTPEEQLKSVNGIQNGPNLVHIVNGETKSTGIESKITSVDTKICLPGKTGVTIPVSEIQQTSIASTKDVSAVSMTPSTLITGSCAGTSPFPTDTEVVSVNAEMKQAPSTSVAQPDMSDETHSNQELVINDYTNTAKVSSNVKLNQTPSTSVALSDVGNETYPTPEQVVNDRTNSTIIESKTMSESKILSTEKYHSSEISQACIVSTINVSETNSSSPALLSKDANLFPPSIQKSTTLSEMNQALSTSESQAKSENICSNPIQPIKDVIKSTGTESKPVSVETNIFSHQKSTTCDVGAPTVNASVTCMAPPTLSSMTASSISTVVSTNSVPAVSGVPQISCLTNKALSDSETKSSLNKARNNAVVTSHQINATNNIVTAAPLEPQQLIQKLSLKPIKNKQPQVATVKPQIITHIIDGFIIEESSEPLPVIRQPFIDSPCKVLPSLKLNTQEEKKNSLMGRRGRKRKRFKAKKCLQKQIFAKNESTIANQDEEILPTPEDESMVSDKTDEENSAPFNNSNDTPIELNILSDDVGLLKSDMFEKLPSKWTVEDVFEFLQNSPGYSEYANNFKSQEVDGQALLLLNENHLQTTLCMKLGPALKLISQIKSIEDQLQS